MFFRLFLLRVILVIFELCQEYAKSCIGLRENCHFLLSQFYIN